MLEKDKIVDFVCTSCDKVQKKKYGDPDNKNIEQEKKNFLRFP